MVLLDVPFGCKRVQFTSPPVYRRFRDSSRGTQTQSDYLGSSDLRAQFFRKMDRFHSLLNLFDIPTCIGRILPTPFADGGESAGTQAKVIVTKPIPQIMPAFVARFCVV